MSERGIVNLLLHEKPAGIILSLKSKEKKYASVLSKENDCTYTHTLKIIEELREYGLVEFERDGRIKFVTLTELGEDVAHELEGLVRYLERVSKEGGDEAQAEEGEEEG
ncbi:MAG: winged helix DNA-binding protein [Candidatus Altiarchaeales archaeon]|nr:winged helix DNA-binding protein [Candidatus Altiarchaeales archaeon]MBD3417347.1 winged helix DNA-binding protein [Candidatus Altiarchaeales archaeon]